MIILGVDPGTLITGYGVVETRNGRLKLVSSGMIRNQSAKAMPERLKSIFETLCDVIRRHRPDAVAVETSFYGKNAQSALKLGQARGVAILAAVSLNLPLAEYSPREVKKAIVGNGTATKRQVQYMVRTMLTIKSPPKQYDITDALAVAICHTQRRPARKGRASDWKSYLAANPGRVYKPSTHKP